MAKMKEINYTEEQTAELIRLYETGLAVSELAAAFDKSERSIVAKLTHESVYRPNSAPIRRPKKCEILKKIADDLSLPLSVLESLGKGTHEALTALTLGIEQLRAQAPDCSGPGQSSSCVRIK